MTFHESAERGDILSTLRIAVVYGSLWAIGSSWSTAIREIVYTFVPDDADTRVVAELGAAAITTLLGVGVALIATRKCSACEKKREPPPPMDESRTRPSSRVRETRRGSRPLPLQKR